MDDSDVLPTHVAIIMDGIAGAAADLGLKYLTLYVFSTENWKRTESEVGYLMGLIRSHLRQEFEFYKEHHIRLKCLGNRAGLPADIQDDIIQAEKDTAAFTGLTLVLAINYGGRDEIVRSVQKLAAQKLDPQQIDENAIAQQFDVPELPDVDLLIRTGGEKRLSNFLLWHASYAELFFTDTLWPDYTKKELYDTIAAFSKRHRRFGAYDTVTGGSTDE